MWNVLHKVAPNADIRLSDKSYLLCSKQDIITFLAQDDTNKMGYIPQERDCDDFAFRLMGQFSVPGWSDLTFGIMWTEVHAMNCLIDENGKFWYVEPQTDKLYETLQDRHGTAILWITI